jgi:hypothetical protein
LGEEKTNNEPENKDTNDILIPDNLHVSIFVNVSGIIINKVYNKSMKAFIFSIETPKVFVDGTTLSTKRIIYKFAIFKKMYRKFKKIIYDGNFVDIIGLFHAFTINKDREGEGEVEHHYLFVVDMKEIDAGEITRNVAREVNGQEG